MRTGWIVVDASWHRSRTWQFGASVARPSQTENKSETERKRSDVSCCHEWGSHACRTARVRTWNGGAVRTGRGVAL